MCSKSDLTKIHRISYPNIHVDNYVLRSPNFGGQNHEAIIGIKPIKNLLIKKCMTRQMMSH